MSQSTQTQLPSKLIAKNLKKRVDVPKICGILGSHLEKLELHKMTIELLTAEEIELLDTLTIDDLPADDGDCLILDAED